LLFDAVLLPPRTYATWVMLPLPLRWKVLFLITDPLPLLLDEAIS